MKRTLAIITLASVLVALPSFAAKPTGPPGDAWIQGKVETVLALNRHLEGYALDATVNNGAVRLTGKVENDIDRDLAGQLAKGVDGVLSVKNEITVADKTRATANASGEHRTFGRWVDDATTTAAVKTKLFADKNIAGRKINVETRGDIVTLSGEVESAEQKQLAEQITKNTGDVKQVRNELTIIRRAN